jgi:hypothetical protein
MTDPDAPPSPSPPEQPDVIPDKGTLLRSIAKFLFYCTVICLGVVLLLLPVSSGRVVARNSAAHRTLNDLCRALEAYCADYGNYPRPPDRTLVADTRYFVSCLSGTSPSRQLRYYHFYDGALADGKYMSSHRKPIHYTFPSEGVPGPDGRIHPNVKYYLWTWGGIGKGPEAAWEINNGDE